MSPLPLHMSLTVFSPSSKLVAQVSATEALAEPDGVTVVIPTFNEVQGVAKVLAELLELLERELAGVAYEIIIVDDGSTDRTADAVRPFESDKLRLLRHPSNRGYGAAIKSGVRVAAYSWILITDADGTYPASHIPELLAYRGGFQMVVGARRGEQVSLIRRPPKWVLKRLASYLIRQDIPDLNSGLRLMRKDVLQRFQNILPDRFSYTTTITLAMFSSGYDVKYIPIEYMKREGKSKIKPIADTIGFAKLIIRTVLYFDPLRIFVPVSAVFVMLAACVAIVSYLLADRVMDVTTVLLFTTGVQMLAIGMLADMMNRRMR
jgi:glycosyltransferase involved in cell wall biosynthesis